MAPIYMRATCCNGSGRIFIKSLSALPLSLSPPFTMWLLLPSICLRFFRKNKKA